MAETGLEVGLLGPFEVTLDGHPIEVPTGKPRRLLACLALSAGHVVSVEELTERLWDTDAPKRARGSLQNNVLLLRRLLGSGSVRTIGGGYLLDTVPDNVDVLRFLRLLDAAAAAEPADARRLLAEACALWRGDPLAGVGSESLDRDYTPVLTERYLAGVERRIDLELSLGTGQDVPATLVAELRALTARFPLREPLWERLLNALTVAGRQAEALEAFGRLRTILADELGADPSARLRALHQRILGNEGPAAPGSPAAARRRPAVPAQLPADISDFRGRTAEVKKASAWLVAPLDALPVTVVSGPGGVGKTTFAVHVAHRVAGTFPDGQLYARLSDAEGRPRESREVLAAFLRALGVTSAAVPETLDERASLYRTLLRGRRVLIVLDNATAEGQVRPLLPGASGAAVLVTSRPRLAGLAGAQFVTLDVLDPAQAIGLLYAVAGPEPFAGDDTSGPAIAELCGHLPLALRIAGSRLAARPYWNARDLAGRLAAQHGRLDELRQGDLEVRASLEVGYDGLEPDLQKAFRRLGLLDAQTFPSWPLAAVLDCDLGIAEDLMERLADVHLVEVAGRDAAGQVRYRFHDLIRLYAREQALAEDSEQERTDAVERALSGWLAAAQAAAGRIPRTFPGRPPAARSWAPAVGATSGHRADVYAWFDSERAALTAAIEQACAQVPLQPAASGPGAADELRAADEPGVAAAGTGSGATGPDGRRWAELAAALATSVSTYLDSRGYFDEWRRAYEVALAAARRTGYRSVQAALLCDLGEVHCVQDRNSTARECFAEALALADETGDSDRVALVNSSLGYLARLESDYGEALDRYRKALLISRESGDLLVQAHATQGLGNIDYDHGRYADAEERFRAALALSRESRFDICAVRALRGLGLVYRDQGDLERAIDHVRQALLVLDEHENAVGRTHAMLDLADLYRMSGRLGEASRLYEESLREFEHHGDRFGVALTRQGQGLLHSAHGRYDHAQDCLAEAAEILADLGMPLWHARCLEDLGRLAAAAGDEARAKEYATLARSLADRAEGPLG